MTPKGSENHCVRELGSRYAAARERLRAFEAQSEDEKREALREFCEGYIEETLRLKNEAIAALEERLEVWATTDAGERIRVGSDGIACRDETIRLLDQKIEKLEQELLDHAEDWALAGIPTDSVTAKRLTEHYHQRARDREDAAKWREHVKNTL